MDRNVDEVLNDLQKAIEAYKQATAQYINEKKHITNQNELASRLVLFRRNTPYLSTILKLMRELEPILIKV